VAGPARRRKTPAEPLEPSRDDVSVGYAVSDFRSTQRKLPPANIEKPKLGFIQRFLSGLEFGARSRLHPFFKIFLFANVSVFMLENDEIETLEVPVKGLKAIPNIS
jgi:hypothetical protein